MFPTNATLAGNAGFVVYYATSRRERTNRAGRSEIYSFWETSMISFRWAAACTLAFALIGGCQPKKAPEVATTEVAPASPERTAAAKARYMAKGDMLVGEVDAAKDGYAAVSGIDSKAVTKGDVLSFIDVERNSVVNHGTFSEVGLSGRIVVEYDSAGERAPRPGDLCVKLK
jgi:hypothetical protein